MAIYRKSTKEVCLLTRKWARYLKKSQLHETTWVIVYGEGEMGETPKIPLYCL